MGRMWANTVRASEATGKPSLKFAGESPGEEAALGSWGAELSQGLQVGCGGRTARAPDRGPGPRKSLRA